MIKEIELFKRPSFFSPTKLNLKEATHPLELSKGMLHYIFFPVLRFYYNRKQIQISPEFSISTNLSLLHKQTLQVLFYLAEETQCTDDCLSFEVNISKVRNTLGLRKNQLFQRLYGLQSQITFFSKNQKFSFLLLKEVRLTNKQYLKVTLSPEFSYFLTCRASLRFIPFDKFRRMLACKKGISFLILENLLLNSSQIKKFSLTKLYYTLSLDLVFPFLAWVRRAIQTEIAIFRQFGFKFRNDIFIFPLRSKGVL